MVEFDPNKLDELLQVLKDLPRIKEIIALKKRLAKEKEKLIPKEPGVAVPKEVIEAIANVKRSSKLQKYWRYIKLIRDNFPDLKVNQIRKQFAQRREGFEVNIPDAVWQNPSP